MKPLTKKQILDFWNALPALAKPAGQEQSSLLSHRHWHCDLNAIRVPKRTQDKHVRPVEKIAKRVKLASLELGAFL